SHKVKIQNIYKYISVWLIVPSQLMVIGFIGAGSFLSRPSFFVLIAEILSFPPNPCTSVTPEK
ncbi:MAG: hypothetical protein QM642_11980, partial [Edaphocola sp.]